MSELEIQGTPLVSVEMSMLDPAHPTSTVLELSDGRLVAGPSIDQRAMSTEPLRMRGGSLRAVMLTTPERRVVAYCRCEVSFTDKWQDVSWNVSKSDETWKVTIQRRDVSVIEFKNRPAVPVVLNRAPIGLPSRTVIVLGNGEHMQGPPVCTCHGKTVKTFNWSVRGSDRIVAIALTTEQNHVITEVSCDLPLGEEYTSLELLFDREEDSWQMVTYYNGLATRWSGYGR